MPTAPVIFLMGPTATGKTELAAALVAHFPLDIISVDSALVYRGMDVGTAKPVPAVLARAPHRLVDRVAPTESYSAARFREDALAAIRDIHGAGRVPLLAGGTGLYFRALEQGLSPLPAADAALRAGLARWREREGNAALHARLAALDPVSAARIHPNDPQRVQRAIEVFELTGRPMGELLGTGRAGRFPYPLLKLALMPRDRSLLRERIARRLEAMLAAGLLEEVRRLRAASGMSRDLPSMRAVGYRQVWGYLEGEYDFAEMKRRLFTATARLAKRQMTWLRGEPDVVTLDPFGPGVEDAMEEHIDRFLAAAVENGQG